MHSDKILNYLLLPTFLGLPWFPSCTKPGCLAFHQLWKDTYVHPKNTFPAQVSQTLFLLLANKEPD